MHNLRQDGTLSEETVTTIFCRILRYDQQTINHRQEPGTPVEQKAFVGIEFTDKGEFKVCLS